jgi:hypothetical protein
VNVNVEAVTIALGKNIVYFTPSTYYFSSFLALFGRQSERKILMSFVGETIRENMYIVIKVATTNNN